MVTEPRDFFRGLAAQILFFGPERGGRLVVAGLGRETGFRILPVTLVLACFIRIRRRGTKVLVERGVAPAGEERDFGSRFGSYRPRQTASEPIAVGGRNTGVGREPRDAALRPSSVGRAWQSAGMELMGEVLERFSGMESFYAGDGSQSTKRGEPDRRAFEAD